MAAEVFDSAGFFLEMRPNRSLSPVGRHLWFGLIASATFVFAGALSVIGAWMVLPYAGVEIVFLWCAFQLIARHDTDYERISVADSEFCWEKCESGRVQNLRGNAAWAQLIVVVTNGRVSLELRYQGRSVSVGSVASNEQRQLLRRHLAQVLKIGSAP